MTDRTEGLRTKYEVHRRFDHDGKHDKCRYFVLDPQHDPIAIDALERYSIAVRDAGFVALSEDLDRWLAELHGVQW